MKIRTSTSHKKLRRMAPRAFRVYQRHADADVTLAVFSTSLAVTAPEFQARYDELRQFLATRKNETLRSTAALQFLVTRIRRWAPHVARDVQTIDVGDFGDNPSVPDDVLGDAASLLEHAAKYVDADGQPVSYLAEIQEDLGAALEAATREWAQAEEAVQGYAALREAVREAAIAFELDLITFRRVLRSVIGRGHPDYQKLRTARARFDDADEDDNVPPIGETPAEPEEVETAEDTPDPDQVDTEEAAE